MGDDNRRPEHPICNNSNEQEDGDHDRRNEVFHNLSFCLESRSGGITFHGIPAHWSRGPERNAVGTRRQRAGDYCCPKGTQTSNIAA